ncbi:MULTISPECIES: beta-N-acetylhexosaminidase [Psychrobacillus]|uniref:Beta-N-acetylhexosaminidase n=1 Tax=Psychrobacillus faecigallinarum TaxID=2762235 RepID=A0ABR8R7D0_9BACI|nr:MULTISPECIES: beta-N-acetylhexosaminidase [Psychrobacillus]MBD7943698.1 beta-N-acetylhexosaminidase [Psychrobacillus faecigallinarum]QEY19220.1 beta-N-acetylhexosaminidase [Psychrobacillus sp. AK 1817]
MGKSDISTQVGQLMIVGFKGKTVPESIIQLIHENRIGGIILFSHNIGSPNELLDLTSTLQLEAKKAGYLYPLLICLDQENGVVRRLGNGTTAFPGAMAIGATRNIENAFNVSFATGQELKELGVNWNLAPVLDVNNNPDNPVIGVRSFGEDPRLVAEFGKKSMKGLQRAGIITTLKHFPGHGDSNVDSHLALPVISHNRKRLNEVELVPFIECINEGADTIMSAHVYFPAIEDRENVPATLSKKVINGLLREELGFDGVVTTDCMEMKAISETIGTEKGAVEALNAGVDLVMVSHTLDVQISTIKEIKRALAEGVLKEETIKASLDRLNKLKEKYLSWETTPFHATFATLGSEKHRQLAEKVFQESVTIVKNESLLPLKTNQKILVINPVNHYIYGVEDTKEIKATLSDAMKEISDHVEGYDISETFNITEMKLLIERAKKFEVIVIGTLSVSSKSYEIDLYEKLLKLGIPVVGVAMRNPYDLRYFPKVAAYLATYEFTYLALRTAAKAIFGKSLVSGDLPVTLTVNGTL